MKRSIFIISFLTFTSSLYASTNVPNLISGDTQWDQTGSPYLIQGKVVVAKGASLQVGAGVQVIFQGASALEVDGTLQVQGSAAAPAVFNMIEGGLQSELFINGGEAHITNAKVSSGVFLVKNARLTMDGTDVTKGSGVYLQGATTARLKNNKIYGNATGVVLDGPVHATLTFNTIVQNSYGLLVKSYSELEFVNNSVHDNQREVINNTPSFSLGGNYWGTDDSKSVQARIQGKVDLNPMRSLKDILRVYVRTQLPVITKQMSLALVAKEKREAKEEAVLMAKLKKEQAGGTQNAEAPAPPSAEAPAEQPAPEQAAAPETPSAAEAPAAEMPSEVAVPTNKIASVKSLPPAPHKLKPLANLPPEQKVTNAMAASAPAGAQPAANAPASPEVPQPPTAAASTNESVIPPAPEDLTAPPSTSASTAVAPPPPEASSTTPPVPPEVSSGTPQAPPPPDMGNMTPPDIETSTPPSNATASSSVPAPPDLNEQVPPSAQKLNDVTGDIDGMQAPPLDLGPDLSNNITADELSGTGQPSTKGAGAKTQSPAGKKPSDASGLALPPMKDGDVAPPKDLDLPPMDDLGNINLDSRNK